MKKHLTKVLSFAMTMFMAFTWSFTLTSCGEEVNIDNPAPNPTEGTVFSSRSDGTRTSIDKDRVFYWETGDYIWLDENNNGSYSTKIDECKLSSDKKSADFYLRGKVLTGASYSLTYTGNNSSSGKSVTIAAEQTQSDWNNAEHFGASGDCGVATATKDPVTGTYSFALQHKAAYLVIFPYKNSAITDNWKLMKIEIIADGTTIAGTYPFSTTGLNTSGATNSSSTITLNCGSDGFALENAAAKHCFAVIQPGTHSLSIRYTVKPSERVDNIEGGTFTLVKDISERDYNINGVTAIRHEISATFYSSTLYYAWDAINPYWYGVDDANIPRIPGGFYSDYPEDASDSRNRWNNTIVAPAQASQSCKDMPNVNVMSWYVMAGDPRWVTNTPSYLDGTGATVYSSGAWFLKKQYILEKEGITEEYMNSIGYDRTTDFRAIMINDEQGKNSSDSYLFGGRPALMNLNKYFFLPAVGHVFEGRRSYQPPHGCYWSSSACGNGSISYGYGLGFDGNEAYVIRMASRNYARITIPEWFQ